MYRILTPKPFRGLKVSPKFIQAKFKYKESIDNAIEYYREYSQYIPTNHILARILFAMSFDPKGSDMDVYRDIDRKVYKIASAYGITSDVSPGHLHSKSFYTNNCALVTCKFGDPLNIPHWKHIRAVRVLTHPYRSLRPILPCFFKTLDHSLYSVVGIDFPLLAVQYKNWFNEEMKRPPNERDQLVDFITKWVMPNMFPEQIDIALRNRMEDLGKGEIREEIDIKPPIFVSGWDKEFDSAYEELIEFYNTAERTFSQVCVGMPMYSAENYWDAIPRCLEGLIIYRYWVTLLVYTDWYYPIPLTFNVEVNTELLYNNMKRVERFVNGSLADKKIDDKIYEAWRKKYDGLLTIWT